MGVYCTVISIVFRTSTELRKHNCSTWVIKTLKTQLQAILNVIFWSREGIVPDVFILAFMQLYSCYEVSSDFTAGHLLDFRGMSIIERLFRYILNSCY